MSTEIAAEAAAMAPKPNGHVHKPSGERGGGERGGGGGDDRGGGNRGGRRRRRGGRGRERAPANA
jgi:hypothetical protein